MMRDFFNLVGLFFIFFSCSAWAEPHINKALQTSGLIVYQDHADPEQFFYLPTNVPVVIGDTLEDFKVTYWGIGRALVDPSTGKSLFGSTVSGRSRICATESQLVRATNETKKKFGVSEARLAPLRLRPGPGVSPVWAGNTLRMGAASDIEFPRTIAFCSNFNFLFGVANHLFASYVATESAMGRGTITNPDFGVNIDAKAQFVGDPWKAECTADLSQVWSHIRRQFSASSRIGWFTLGGADYLKITQDLTRNGTISCDFEEGDMDTRQFGYQIFEMVKTALQELNTKVAAGEGFFRFEPIPDPEVVSAGSAAGWGWGLKVNAAYSENHFKQSITWRQTLSYTGRIEQEVPTSMTLAVQCNRATERYFSDITDPGRPCITPSKSRDFLDRMDRERGLQNQARAIVQNRYDSGQYDRNDFERIIDQLDQRSLAEDQSRVLLVDVTDKDIVQPLELNKAFISTPLLEDVLSEIEEAVVGK